MDLREQFVGELRALTQGRFDDLSPSLLAEAVRRVLDVPGAGFVMLHRLVRLLVGAAGDDVSEAERLQTTLGEGPCLASAAEGHALTTDEDELRTRWPLYDRSLITRTPYRSTASFPLRRGGTVFAALDVYGHGRALPTGHPPEVVDDRIADLAAAVLQGALCSDEVLLGHRVPAGLERRRRVLVAVGMMQEAAEVDDLDALALLRGTPSGRRPTWTPSPPVSSAATSPPARFSTGCDRRS